MSLSLPTPANDDPEYAEDTCDMCGNYNFWLLYHKSQILVTCSECQSLHAIIDP